MRNEVWFALSLWGSTPIHTYRVPSITVKGVGSFFTEASVLSSELPFSMLLIFHCITFEKQCGNIRGHYNVKLKIFWKVIIIKIISTDPFRFHMVILL